MPSRLIRYLGTLPEDSWKPAQFSHRRLTARGRQTLNSHEVFSLGSEEGDFPDASEIDQASRVLFDALIPSWRHAIATGGGVLAGKGSVSAHDDGTPG